MTDHRLSPATPSFYLCLSFQLLIFIFLSLEPMLFKSQQKFEHFEPNPALLALSFQFKEQELAQIFLTNHGKLSPEDQSAITQAGLAHYLALSAGQLGPAIDFIMLAFSQLALAGLNMRMFKPNKLSQSSSHDIVKTHWLSSVIPQILLRNRYWIGLMLALSLCLLYGFTGSLIRVLLWQYLFVAVVEYCLKKHIPMGYLKEQEFFLLFLTLLFYVFTKKNLFTDWSFLYAALGARTFVLASRSSKNIVSLIQNQSPHFQNKLIQKVIAMVLAQCSCTLIFAPLTPMHFISAICTNLLVAPLMTYTIVPLTLFLTLCVQLGLETNPNSMTLTGNLAQPLIALTDHCLSLFKAIAFVFTNSSENSLQSKHSSFLPAFSVQARIYVLILLALMTFLPQISARMRPPFTRRQNPQIKPESQSRSES